jgi:hypothetical protein
MLQFARFRGVSRFLRQPHFPKTLLYSPTQSGVYSDRELRGDPRPARPARPLFAAIKSIC